MVAGGSPTVDGYYSYLTKAAPFVFAAFSLTCKEMKNEMLIKSH